VPAGSSSAPLNFDAGRGVCRVLCHIPIDFLSRLARERSLFPMPVPRIARSGSDGCQTPLPAGSPRIKMPRTGGTSRGRITCLTPLRVIHDIGRDTGAVKFRAPFRKRISRDLKAGRGLPLYCLRRMAAACVWLLMELFSPSRNVFYGKNRARSGPDIGKPMGPSLLQQERS
jgi:hypothetical protein